MSKASIFVISCSASIIVSFCVFCYLLNTVNPDPVGNETVYMRVSDVPKEDLAYINEQFSAQDDLQYGLEKVPEGYDMKSTFNTEVTWDDSDRISNPVQIPIVRYTGPLGTSTTPHDKSNDLKPITVLVYPMKDVRRSIEANNSSKSKLRDTNNLLLKIVDDSGKARMEVIVDSGQIHYNDQSRSDRNSTKELNVYEIKPNNTLLYNIAEQSLKIVANDAKSKSRA